MYLLHNKYFIVFFTFNTVWNTVCNPCLNLLFRPDDPAVAARISMFRWPADFQRPHCKNCSILAVCFAHHQKDQALSYTAHCTTSCPGPCLFKTGLLQCSSSWTSIKHNQTSTNDSECSGMTGLQRAQKSPCYTSLYLPALATSCSSHPVQDTDACI